MNKHLETMLNFIQQSKELSDDAKNDLVKNVQNADGEMEDKNHELEIEAALEKVRAVAMGMNTPDDLLNICKELFKELQHLQFGEVRNVIIHTYLEGKNYFIDYDYSDFTNGHISKIPYSGNPIIEKFVQDIRRSRDAFTEIIITGNDLKQWQSFRDANNEVADERLSKTSALYYYIYSIGDASIGISTFKPISADKQEVLKRFRNVFDLAYKRYVDITNAEAQTREAEIEASLERMRSVAMSMNKPDDLLNICETMYREFNSFGFAKMRNAMINIHNDENKTFVNYDYSDTIGRSINHLHYDIHPVIEKQIMQMRSATDAFSETVFERKDLADWKKFRAEVGEKDDPRINEATALYYYFYSIGTGSIGISSFTPVKEKKLEVLKRFRNVFNLSYQRYTDIALAEAQAREAQIELALERVRARTMAMQRSDELAETASLLFKQIHDLGIQTWTSGFNIWKKDDSSFIGYNPSPTGGITPPYHIPSKEDRFFIDIYDAKKRGEDFFVFESAGKSLAETYSYMKTLPVVKEVLNDIEDAGVQLPTFQINHCVFFSHGFLLFITLEPYSNAHDIFKRFGKVFDQTYTRFLDLQKAEAQAREAQIETALERVRSRTMAMQKSKELKEVIQVVYDQFIHLNIHVEHTGFIIDYKEREDMYIWLADKHAVPFQVAIPYFDCAHWNSFNEAKEKGIDFFSNELSFEEKNKFYQDLFKLIPGVPEETLQYYFSCPGLAISTVLLENVGLYIENFSGIPYSDEENKTLMRFGKVFQQTYTRFLDLQKAEAQAREAQVEAALERVRSRAMAMRKTDELLEAAEFVYKELLSLGIESMNVSYSFVDEEEKSAYYYSINPVDGKVMTFPMVFPHTETEVMRSILSSWKKQEPLNVVELDEEGTVTHQTWAGEHILKLITKNNIDIPFSIEAFLAISPKTAVIYTFNFVNGYLFVIGEERLTKMQEEIVLRFTKVFEMTYRRFLDIQLAEAHAEKAQIEEQKLREEKKRSDALLLNILPEEIANELKLYGKSYARKHEEVTILFCDIKGFSTISEDLSADELVTQLDECFRAFDKIVEKHCLEKIKTVGDAYICACGLPTPVIDNAIKTVRAAIDMLDFLKGFNSSKKVQDLPAFEFRIGIHTGPVVTGVVGLKKFTYDIWGDAVNMAARMEQHGEAGRINVSGNTYQLIKDKFTCTPRGKILAKNKGEVEMYFVDSI